MIAAATQPAPSPAKSLDDTRRELAELRLLLFNNIHDLACHSADERLQLAANIACVNLVNQIEGLHLQWEKLRLRQQTLALAERHVELAERREARLEQSDEPRASASGPADTQITCAQPAPEAPDAEQPAPSDPPLTPEELAEIAEAFPSTKHTDIDRTRDAACWRETLRITRYHADLLRAARKESRNAASAPAPDAGASPAPRPCPAPAMLDLPAASQSDAAAMPPTDSAPSAPPAAEQSTTSNAAPHNHNRRDPALAPFNDFLPELCAPTTRARDAPQAA
jgi:hypothetical protein